MNRDCFRLTEVQLARLAALPPTGSTILQCWKRSPIAGRGASVKDKTVENLVGQGIVDLRSKQNQE